MKITLRNYFPAALRSIPPETQGYAHEFHGMVTLASVTIQRDPTTDQEWPFSTMILETISILTIQLNLRQDIHISILRVAVIMFCSSSS